MRHRGGTVPTVAHRRHCFPDCFDCAPHRTGRSPLRRSGLSFFPIRASHQSPHRHDAPQVTAPFPARNDLAFSLSNVHFMKTTHGRRLSVAQAAAAAGLSPRAIYDMVNNGTLVAHGTPLRIDEAAVVELITARQIVTAARIGDLVRFAQQLRTRLQTPGDARRNVDTPDRQDARAVFGPHVVKAAALPPGSGCRWCWARSNAIVHGGLHPQLDDPTRVLLGEPCPEDLTALRDQLRNRYVASLPAPRGRKACGTPVGRACGCHTSDRKLAARLKAGEPAKPAKPAKPASAIRRRQPTRSQIHGCGCTCTECEARR